MTLHWEWLVYRGLDVALGISTTGNFFIADLICVSSFESSRNAGRKLVSESCPDEKDCRR